MRIFATFILFFCFGFGLAQDIQSFGYPEGLKSRKVSAMAEDSLGYIWIGTWNGLYRFNGKNFHSVKDIFPHAPFDIASGKIESLACSASGELIVSLSPAVYQIDLDKGSISQIPLPKTMHQQPISNWAKDQSGHLLGSTANGRIYELRNQTIHEIYVLAGSGKNVESFQIDADDRIWITTGASLRQLQISNGKVNPQKNWDIPTNQFCLLNDRPFVTIQRKGIFSIPEDSDTLKPFITGTSNWPNFKSFNSTTLPPIKAFAQFGNNQIWISNYKSQLVKYDIQTGQFTDYTDILQQQLGPRIVRGFFKDSRNNLWVYTWNGLLRLSRSDQSAPAFFESEKGFSSRSMLILPDSGILVSTYSGFFHFDPHLQQKEKWKHRYINKNGNVNLTLPVVCFSQVKQTDSTFLCGSESQGLLFGKLDSTAKEVKLFQIQNELKGRQECKSFLPLDSSRFLLGGLDGLMILDTVSGVIQRQKLYFDGGPTEKIKAFDLQRIPGSSNIWICSQLGLMEVNSDFKIEHWFSTLHGTPRLTHDQIQSMAYDTLTNSWFLGGTGGLQILDLTAKSLLTTSEFSGNFEDPSVVAVINDSLVVWAFTLHGAYQYHKASKVLTRVNHFPKNFEFNLKSALNYDSSRLFAGGIGGILPFDKPKPDLNPIHKARLSIEWITFSPDKNKPDTTLVLSYTKSKNITLQESTRPIEIGVQSIGQGFLSEAEYQVQLLGYQDAWLPISGNQTIVYQNLAPNDYSFSVRYRVGLGKWVYNSNQLTISIDPPFYRSWWFLSLVFILIVGVFGFVNWLKLEKLKSIELERARIARDLHDELGGILTGISIQCELNALGSTTNATSAFQKILDLSRTATVNLGDTVWSIKSSNNQFHSLKDRISEYAQTLLTPKGIDWKIQVKAISEKVEMNYEVRNNLYLVCKEAMNNIAKHSDATRVVIGFHNRTNSFELYIVDNGSLTELPSMEKGNGLHNMIRRASIIGGKVEYAVHQGFEIKLTLGKRL